MIKLYLASLIAVTTLSANETQVFSSQTNPIALGASSNFEKLYYGSAELFCEAPAKYVNTTTLKTASERGMKAIQIPHSSEAVKMLASTQSVMPGKIFFDQNTTDHHYIYVSVATNNKGDQTVVYTLVVSKNKLQTPEGEALAIADQKKL
jgi:hypothetical protein